MASETVSETKIDEFLIKAITPKTDLAMKKIADGEALSSEDMTNLHLLAQFNHIAHLDHEQTQIRKRLDSFDRDFAGIGTKFANVDVQFANVDAKFANVDVQFANVDAKLANVDAKLADLKAEMQTMITNQTKWFVGSLVVIGVVFKMIDIFVKV